MESTTFCWTAGFASRPTCQQDEFFNDGTEVVQCGARPRMCREEHALLEPRQASNDMPKTFRLRHVCFAVDGGDDVVAWLDFELREHLGTLARDRREDPRCVGHHVADDFPPAGYALAFSQRDTVVTMVLTKLNGGCCSPN